MMAADRSKRGAAINPASAFPTHDPRYQRDCTLAVDASVESLVDLAAGAGWVRQNVLVGIILAAARQLADDAILERLELIHAAERRADGLLQ